MNFLPIKSLREEDSPLVEANLLNLTKLIHFDLPVASGIVVFPPHLEFKNILKHLEHQGKEVFEQQLTIIKKQILQTPCPPDLQAELKSRKIDSQKAWQTLLEIWLEQIRSQIYRQGIVKDVSKNLKAEPIFFSGKILSSVESFYDPVFKETFIKVKFGQITEEQIQKIKDYTTQANKKLVLHQVFDWITNPKIELVRLKPFTQANHPEETKDQSVILKSEAALPIRPAMKIFVNLGPNFSLKKDVDGVLIRAEDIEELADRQTKIDKKMLQLVEAAATLKNKFVIFKLSDKTDSFGGVRGALRLIHDQTLLKEEAEIFLFARNKKGLLNTHLAIPFARSSEEFLQLKRELAALGIARKGSLKLWLEIGLPENIINIKDYIEAGFDGVLLNLDELAAWVGGFDPKVPESVFYKKQLKACLELVKMIIKPLHQAEIPILAYGQMVLEADVTKFLMENGVWGVVGDYVNILGIEEHLVEMEKRLLRSKK